MTLNFHIKSSQPHFKAPSKHGFLINVDTLMDTTTSYLEFLIDVLTQFPNLDELVALRQILTYVTGQLTTHYTHFGPRARLPSNWAVEGVAMTG